MSSILWIIPIAIVIGLGVWYMKRRKAAERAIKADHGVSIVIPDACSDDANRYFTRPDQKGVTVRSFGPVPTEQALQLIDSGIAHTLRNTENQNWTNFRTIEEFEVFLVPPATHNVETDPGSPAILVRQLDPNGVDVRETQAAGTCIGVEGGVLGKTDTRYPAIVLPYEDTELPAHAVYLEESARNEAEHIVMWVNNKNMFFNYVGANDQHPIFPDA